MDPSFWRARWAERQIGFHLPHPNPALVRHLGRLGPPGRIFVPLCGKSVDLHHLAAAGFEVVGVELVESALVELYREAGVEPVREEGPGRVTFRAAGLTTHAADFFAVGPELVGRFPAIYDRAALVAMPPERRAAYVDHLLRLAEPGAVILLVAFHYEGPMSGPPFSVPPEELARLFAGRGTLTSLEARDVLDEEPRFKARGLTRLVEEVVRVVVG